MEKIHLKIMEYKYLYENICNKTIVIRKIFKIILVLTSEIL